jgi:hypothetical protein
MVSLFWPKELEQACFYAYHPGLHSQGPGYITSNFLWHWGVYPSDALPDWERVFIQGRDEYGRFIQGLFPTLQRALTEGQEDDKVFALFLLGTLATPEAVDFLISFLNSPTAKSVGQVLLRWDGSKRSKCFLCYKLFCWKALPGTRSLSMLKSFRECEKCAATIEESPGVRHQRRLPKLIGIS